MPKNPSKYTESQYNDVVDQVHTFLKCHYEVQMAHLQDRLHNFEITHWGELKQSLLEELNSQSWNGNNRDQVIRFIIHWLDSATTD